MYFQSADSLTTNTQLTDASGNATAMLEAGGYVTVVKPEAPLRDVIAAIGPRASLATFAAVQPGDHLYVDVPFDDGSSGEVTFTVQVPNEEQGYGYRLHTTCGSAFIGTGQSPLQGNQRRRARGAIAAEPLTAEVALSGCGGMADMLVVGTDSDGQVRSWQYKANVAVVQNAVVEFTSYESPSNQELAYRVYPTVDRVDVSRELRTARGFLYADNDSVFFESNTGSTTMDLPTPAGVLAITTSTAFGGSSYSRSRIIDWGANTSVEVDFSTLALSAYDTQPSFDTATREVAWTETLDGNVPQLTIAQVSAFRSENEVNTQWNWELIAPRAQTKVAYPVLPTTLFDFNIKGTDDPFVQRLTTAQVPGGYNAVRSRVFAGDLEGAVVSGTGRIVIEDQFFGEGFTGAITSALRRGGFTRRAR
ncbi:MAG: hypothetical protein H7138_25270 [Myxococcales bacterium]|nr:hypothetical protein [Myxococcales bacterium]